MRDCMRRCFLSSRYKTNTNAPHIITDSDTAIKTPVILESSSAILNKLKIINLNKK